MARKQKRKAAEVSLAEHLDSIRSQGGAARQAQMTDAEREELARSGGEARAAALSKKRRREIAQAAARARWASKQKK